MRHHVNHTAHAPALDQVAKQIALAEDALAVRPLSTSELAWAKGCLENGVGVLGQVIAASTPAAA